MGSTSPTLDGGIEQILESIRINGRPVGVQDITRAGCLDIDSSAELATQSGDMGAKSLGGGGRRVIAP